MYSQMAEPWFIPRASIGSVSTQSVSNSISGSSGNSSRSNRVRRSSLDEPREKHAYFNRGYHYGRDNSLSTKDSGSVKSEQFNSNKQNSIYNNNKITNNKDYSGNIKRNESEMKLRLDELKNRFDETSNSNNGCSKKNELGPKRGSRSSQGSTDSNHSSHSASSGSLLLTVANLENFARVHQKMNKHLYIKEEDIHEASAYSTNITINPHLEMSNKQINHKHVPDSDAITIDISPDILKFKLRNSSTKDFDSMSMASSTHFTVVNGIGRPPKVPKSSLCDRGHQITVLIVTMSMFFMIGISLAVYFMEMRAREMPY